MEGLEASIGALEAAIGDPEAAIGSPEAAIGGPGAAATRGQRGTGGKRQKQAVKFTGQIEIQASVAGSSAPGASPAPAGGDTGAAPAPTGGNTATGNTAPAK